MTDAAFRSFPALCASRYSCRAYADRDVPRELVDQALEAARLAPSACNQQPWRLAVVTHEATREAIFRGALLPGLSCQWIRGAPLLVVLGIQRSTVTHRMAPLFSRIDYPLIDAGIAGEHLVLQAEALGLGSCWVGWIRPAPLRRLVGWPRSVTPVSLITLGWPAEGARPAHPRPRKPMAEIATWL